MFSSLRRGSVGLLALAAAGRLAAETFVDPNSPSPASPFNSWPTAAHTLQEAVDAAAPGGLVLVTNGVYATGGRAAFGTMTNRVTIDKLLTVQSVNGPQFTAIRGDQGPGLTNSSSAVRCVYLATAASLSGFTLTGGATHDTGDYDHERSGGGLWCESSHAYVSNCVIAGNLAGSGAGAYSGTLLNCVLRGNTADYAGGGARYSALLNCVVATNSAGNYGGGVGDGTLTNCSVAGNSASYGGGVGFGILANCIVYWNFAATNADRNCYGSTLDFSCTTPQPAGGTGNLSADPLFVSLFGNLRLQSNSPCINAGTNAFAYGWDLDGNPRIYAGTVDLGAYEFQGNVSPGAPYIVFQPTNVTVVAGSDARFNVTAGGSPPLSYQWQSNAVNIAGATNSWLVVTNTQLAQSGTRFAVVVTNAAGSMTSSNAVLTVTPFTSVAPYIITQPTNLTVIQGSNATFTVTADGTPPLIYRWRFQGNTVSAQVTNWWTVTNARPADAGEYSVVISNAWGGVISSNAVLTVVPPPPPATHYVDLNNPSPASPYTNWATAARTIQDAVDAAGSGDEIIVTNGVYASGGRVVYGSLSNRVAVTKPVTVRSVSGPQYTFIQGNQVPGTTNGDAAVRCVYLANGSSLIGFTLTQGATRSVGDVLAEQCGGALWCGATGIVSVAVTVSNCVLTGNAAAYRGGGTYQGTFYKCNFSGNTASWGGGAGWATLFDCGLTNNSADYGGGQAYSTLSNCTLVANTATTRGGGGAYSTLYHCGLSGNSAPAGGGDFYGTLHYCTLIGNAASSTYGGGTEFGLLNNCLLISNTAPIGGGAYYGAMSNCTLSANAATTSGGGMAGSGLLNCVVISNSAPSEANYSGGSLDWCCTTPLPAGGQGNLAADPKFVNAAAGNLRLLSNSPCINAGVNAAVGGATDLDGNPRISSGVVDIGAYEYQGNLAPAIVIQPTNQTVLAGVMVVFNVGVWGTPPFSYQWSFGGSPLAGATNSFLVLTNAQPDQSGNYAVTVTNLVGSATSSNALLQVLAPSVRYVDAASANPVAPYSTWATAAPTIQQAIDAALPTEEIVVTNGLYATGGRVVYGSLTNRVAVTKPLTVRSVNGPDFTVIQGYQLPGTTNGDAAVRCVYLTNGATLVGFTLTGGATRTTGDQWREWCGGGLWCESASAVASNCVLAGNCAYDDGGGAYGGTLNQCELRGNTASAGGGASGGWPSVCALNGCLVTGNAASEGGGVYGSTLSRCLVSSNTANLGGGVSGASLNNCLLTGNTAAAFGGGAASSSLYDCTVTGNSAAHGGGAYGNYTNSTLRNCVIYYNSSPDGSNYWGSQFSYCCTAPTPLFGYANLTNEPLFLDLAGGNFRLQPMSPCVNAGYNGYALGAADFDGNPRIVGGTVDIGAYEFQGAGAGNTHFVNTASTSPQSPFLAWSTAATNIQDAVDAAAGGDTVLVADGLYATGGRAVYGTMTNRVAVDKPVAVRSVGGPSSTVIQGYQLPGTTNGDGAVRCVYLTNGATLAGFTLTGGATRTTGDQWREWCGGGLWCESASAVASNCVLAGNCAYDDGGGAYGGTLNQCELRGNTASAGGGASGGWPSVCALNGCLVTGNAASEGGGASGPVVMDNCLLVGNSASDSGGGIWGISFAALTNCTVVGNIAGTHGGGIWMTNGSVQNCIVYYNYAPTFDNWEMYWSPEVDNTCTFPAPVYGSGNITDDPLFVDLYGGDFHLQAGSPCINAGLNQFAAGATDLDGNPRLVGGTVDLGAYEFQGTAPASFHAWLQSYGLPTDGSADYLDSDGDGMNNWQEWRCGTDPTNAQSVLRMLPAVWSGNDLVLSWQSVAGVNYFLQRSIGLGSNAFFSVIATNLPGQSGTNYPGLGGITRYTDTDAASADGRYYRVGVGP